MLHKETKNLLTVLFTALTLITVCVSMSHAQVTLTVGKSSALPGATGSTVAVSLDNPDNTIASGLTMDVCDVNDFLECTGCVKTDRTDGFSCAVNELANGCCRVVMFSVSSDDIATGNGPIVTLVNTVSNGASGCRDITILENVQIADGDTNQQLDADLQPGGFCFPCTSDADCDDGLYCNGEESCADDACVPGTNPCPAQQVCVEDSDVCTDSSTTTTSGPSTTTTTGPSTTTTSGPSTTTTTGPSTTTTTVPGEASIEILKDTFWKSRWVALPFLLVIEGNETNFQPLRTTLSFEPADAVLKLFPIVLGKNHIWNIILVMPVWFAGPGDQEVTVTVTTGDEVVADTFLIRELPFIFEQK